MNDLFEILEERYSYSEIVELLNEFNEERLREYAIDHEVCPRCAGMLFTHNWEEKREWWGSICFEPLSELKCENCGETY